LAASERRADPARLPRLRAAAQLLHRPVSIRDSVEVARAVAGAQAQDMFAARLSFRSRSRWLKAADIDRARTEERSLLRTWVMRMTIHLIPSDDAGWWLPLFEPGIEKWSRRRLGQLGMPARTQERALREVVRMLERDGPLTRTEVGNRLREMGIELNNSTRGHIMGLAVTSGNACLGPDRKGGSCLVLRRDWLGDLPPFDREKALAELARRYLSAFGPATDRDFAYWAGLGLGEVRAGLEAISAELEEVRVEEETLLALRGELPRLPRAGQLRMLGNFDTYLLGWKDRSFSVPDHHVAAVKEGGGGWIRPVIVRDGVVIGGWRSSRKAGGIEISFNLSGSISAAARKAIDAEVEDIERFEGLPVNVVSP
jgi:uncharacterized protein YcaQ